VKTNSFSRNKLNLTQVKMALTVSDIYAARFGQLLNLPDKVQRAISQLRTTQVPYKPVRPFVRRVYKQHTSNGLPDNWREKILVEYVRRVKEREDPEYSDIFSIFNKIAPSNIESLSASAITLIQKRDKTFRLRVSMLLFDKAITQSMYSAIMAECAARLHDVIPEIAEDLQSQISMFPTLYNMTETCTFPENTDEKFDEKVIEWTKQKEKRRGYAKFMMELFNIGLISEESVRNGFEQVLKELKETASRPKTSQTEENATQFATFLFECSKNVKLELREYLKNELQQFLALPKESLPSLNMRSKFKIEDALKELNKEQNS
jgi:hypothetical protein